VFFFLSSFAGGSSAGNMLSIGPSKPASVYQIGSSGLFLVVGGARIYG
jgi:hypothetical protein